MKPAQNVQYEEESQNKTQKKDKLEQRFLKGKMDADLGVFFDLFSAKSNHKGQDGGVASALLAAGLELGVVDLVVAVWRGEGYSAQVKVTQNAVEVLESAGTVYLKANVTKKLREIIAQGTKKIALVCTPCEAEIARRIKQTLKGKYQITILGLFCYGAFNKDKLKKVTEAQLGIDIDKAEKTQVRKGKFSAFLDGKEFSCNLKDIDSATEKTCHFCDDFTSRFADLSVGSVGSKEGYSTVIVRSAAGENLVKLLVAEKKAADLEEIRRIAKSKKNRAKKNTAALNVSK